jgi:ADP-L-glycero-D-manno-heptose 6-epimerase
MVRMIVVTGAAGFLGSAAVWALNQRGISNIVCVDTARSADGIANLAPLRFEAYVPHDTFRRELRDGVWAGRMRGIIHLGACSSTTEQNWAYLQDNNLEYTKDVCLAGLAAGARVIVASSAATYGNGEHGYADDHAGIDRLQPLNLYGRSKHEFDLWARDHGYLDQIVALKYFNVYGPNEWHKGDMRSMVCKGFEQIRDTGRVRLFKSRRPEYPDGGQRRDFIYVKDAIAMTLWLLDHPEHNGIFNIGTGASTDWNRLMRAIFSAMGLEPQIDYFDMPEDIARAYQYDTCADMTKLRAAGYPAPVMPVEVAVRDYVLNYLEPHQPLR